jgi:hypothetical protein
MPLGSDARRPPQRPGMAAGSVGPPPFDRTPRLVPGLRADLVEGRRWPKRPHGTRRRSAPPCRCRDRRPRSGSGGPDCDVGDAFLSNPRIRIGQGATFPASGHVGRGRSSSRTFRLVVEDQELEWISLRRTVRPMPEDVLDLAPPFHVPGREARQVFAEFGEDPPSWQPELGVSYPVRIERKVRGRWATLVDFEWWAPKNDPGRTSRTGTRPEQPHPARTPPPSRERLRSARKMTTDTGWANAHLSARPSHSPLFKLGRSRWLSGSGPDEAGSSLAAQPRRKPGTQDAPSHASDEIHSAPQ